MFISWFDLIIKKKLFSEHQRSVCRLCLRGHSDQDQPQFKNHEEQILFNRTITQQVQNFSLRKTYHLHSVLKFIFISFFTQVPDSLRLDSAHRDDRQVWYEEISQENKSDIFVNSSTVFSFTLDYEYFKGTDLYLFRWQTHMFPIPIHQFHLMFKLSLYFLKIPSEMEVALRWGADGTILLRLLGSSGFGKYTTWWA